MQKMMRAAFLAVLMASPALSAERDADLDMITDLLYRTDCEDLVAVMNATPTQNPDISRRRLAVWALLTGMATEMSRDNPDIAGATMVAFQTFALNCRLHPDWKGLAALTTLPSLE